MKLRQLAVVALVVLLVMPSPAVGAVRGSPDLSATAPSNTFLAGGADTLEITLTNEGELDVGSTQNPSLNSEVTTARGVEATLDASGTPIDVETGSQSIGSLPEGGSPTLPYRLTIDQDAEPGTYTLELEVEYRYTSSVSEANGGRNTETQTRTFDIEVEIEDRARFDVVSTETDVRVGSSGTVAVTVENVGAEAAEDATVALESRNTDITFGQSSSASRFVGEWEPGERRTVEYQVSAAGSAEQQQYAFSATATFEDAEGVTRQSESLSLGVTPEAEQRFSVVSTESDVAVGDSGDVSVTLRNDGSIPVNDATVELASQSSDLVFGESASASRYVGDWAPGETRTVEYDVSATDGTDTRNYAMQATVSYEDEDDDPATSRALSLGVTPEPEQSFSLSNVESNLEVGEERTISGTITNDGRTVARDAVIQFTTQGQNVNPVETEYSVGTLEPGASADFEFSVEISEAADAGPRQFSLVTEYRNSDGDTRASDELLTRQAVAPQSDAFAVEVVEGSLANGDSTELEVRVTNTANETLSSISGKLFADDPISANDDEAFIDELAPGESTTITYTISASGAIPKSYPVSMDFQYDDADGDTQVSNTYRVPVEVTESQGNDGGNFPIVIVGIGLAAVVGIGAVLRFR